MAPISQHYKAHVSAKLYEQSLQTSALELQYAERTHLIDIIAKDEDIRNLRFDVHILQDDNDELRDLLAQEETRSDAFEKLVNESLQKAEIAETRLLEREEELRMREQDLGVLQAEAKALQTSAADSEAFLTEKLALTRELSILRPELAHLKEQAASAEALMSEKLELQRQLTEQQCQLENARRDIKRAMAKRRNTGVEIAQEEQVEDLKRQLAKEKRARLRAEEAADVTQSDISVDEVRKELAREKRARQKAEEALEAAQDNTQVEDVRRDLLKEKKAKQRLEETIETLQIELEKEKRAAAKATKRAEGNVEADDQLEEIRQELAKEKKERAKAERAIQRTVDEFEAQKTMLDEKLGQFRTKLKSTKEKLKETEAELAETKDAAQAGPKSKSVATQAPKKRNAAQLDHDATNLGTPGDGPVAKRGRKAVLGVGDKSTFSITPFLNRTRNAASEGSGDEGSDAEAEDRGHASPSADKALEKEKAKEQEKPPLAQVSASEANMPQKKATAPRPRKQPKAKPVLEMVTEEAVENDIFSQGQENAPTGQQQQAMRVKTKSVDGPTEQPENTDGAKKKKPKMRKSLVDFETFNQEPAPEKKRKRKLGGLGKTLFDEEEEHAAPAKAVPARTFLGGGKLSVGAKKAGGFLGASRIGSTLLMAGDGSGFQFSPLKKQRRNLDDTLRG